MEKEMKNGNRAVLEGYEKDLDMLVYQIRRAGYDLANTSKTDFKRVRQLRDEIKEIKDKIMSN
jgi:hypothetical protein